MYLLAIRPVRVDSTTFDKLFIDNSDSDIPLIWGDFVNQKDRYRSQGYNECT